MLDNRATCERSIRGGFGPRAGLARTSTFTRMFRGLAFIRTRVQPPPAQFSYPCPQLGPGLDHTWVFTVGLVKVNMAPEQIVFCVWILGRRLRTELTKKEVLGRRTERQRRFRILQQI